MSFQKKVTKDSVGALLNPCRSDREKLERKGVRPKDHHRENIRVIKRAEQGNRLKKEEEEIKRNTEPYKLKQFREVESVVSRTVKEPSQKAPVHQNFVRAGTGKPAMVPLPSEPYQSKKVKTKPSVPTKNEALHLAPRKEKNYLAENYKASANMPVPDRAIDKIAPREDVRYTTKSEYGKVPEYIRNRKMELDAESRQRREAEEYAALREAGHGRLLPEDIRVQTLQQLEEAQRLVMEQLHKMPMIVDTEPLKRRQTELERKLRQLEGAIRKYSASRVYVTDD